MTKLKQPAKIAALAVLLATAGCASLTPKVETREAYVVIDGVGTPSNRLSEQLLRGVTEAVQSRVSSVRAARSIPPTPLPKEPGTFALKSPFAGNPILGQVKVPACSNTILEIRSSDTGLARYGDQTTFFACVMVHAGGYRAAVYASHSRTTGLLSPGTVGGSIGSLIVGDGTQFVPGVMQSVKAVMAKNLNGAKIVESYIPDDFAGPMVNETAGLQAAE